MNIFYLDPNPKRAAQMMCDKHVVKMILESAQMLSTAHRELDGSNLNDKMYKVAHKNHPSTKWARENSAQYMWLYDHFVALCEEYTHRYGKTHMTDSKLREILRQPPRMIDQNKQFNQPPQCMPDEYKIENDSVQAYQNYYINEKKDFATWKDCRGEPDWWKGA